MTKNQQAGTSGTVKPNDAGYVLSLLERLEAKLKENAAVVNIYHITVTGNSGTISGVSNVDSEDSRSYHGQPVFNVEKNSTATFQKGGTR